MRAERKSPQTVRVYTGSLQVFIVWCALDGREPMLNRDNVRDLAHSLPSLIAGRDEGEVSCSACASVSMSTYNWARRSRSHRIASCRRVSRYAIQGTAVAMAASPAGTSATTVGVPMARSYGLHRRP